MRPESDAVEVSCGHAGVEQKIFFINSTRGPGFLPACSRHFSPPDRPFPKNYSRPGNRKFSIREERGAKKCRAVYNERKRDGCNKRNKIHAIRRGKKSGKNGVSQSRGLDFFVFSRTRTENQANTRSIEFASTCSNLPVKIYRFLLV